MSNRGRFRERCSLVAPSRKEVEEQRPSHQHTILTSLKNFDCGEKSPALVMALILVKINPLLYFHIFEIFWAVHYVIYREKSQGHPQLSEGLLAKVFTNLLLLEKYKRY